MIKTSLVAQYSQVLLKLFAELIPADRPLAHVDFPDYPNSGDHAIWLGEKKLLKRLALSSAYDCSLDSYDRAEMAAALRDGTILMHGGGNFGDRWRKHQDFRLQLLRDFPQNKVVVFPQTVGFLDNSYLRQCSEAFTKHGNVTICARDVVSHHVLKTFFMGSGIVLAPDMAFLLGPCKRLVEPAYDVVWIARTDQESVARKLALKAAGLISQPQPFSFPHFEDGVELVFAGRHRKPDVLLTDWLSISPKNEKAEKSEKQLDFEQKSKLYVSRAMLLLSLGHTVITDRLHGHILCILMRIPHIFLNNNYGKNWNFYDSWTRESPLCRLARNPSEAWAMIQKE